MFVVDLCCCCCAAVLVLRGVIIAVSVVCCCVRVVLVWLSLCVVGVGISRCGCCDRRCGCSLWLCCCLWRVLLGLCLLVGVWRSLRRVVVARCCCSLLCFVGFNVPVPDVVVRCRCLMLLDA